MSAVMAVRCGLSGWRVIKVSTVLTQITRRNLLIMLLAAGALLPCGSALADKGSGGGDNDGGGDDHDGGDNDGGGDDDGGDDDGGDDNSGSGSNKDNEDGGGGKRLREAVKKGEAAPLKDILAVVRRSYTGEVVRIRLSGSGGKLVYSIRLLDSHNKLIEVRVNARSRQIISATGV
jgi:uncharacterized membrane protein YkoI